MFLIGYVECVIYMCVNTILRYLEILDMNISLCMLIASSFVACSLLEIGEIIF